MEDLYSFLKKKLKENNIKIGTFIEKTGMSKSTIYRVMKGYQKPSDELLELMVSILKLNSEDKRKLNYLISMIDMDQSSIEASNAVKNFLFEQKSNITKDIEFIYYKNEEKYIKSFKDIIQTLNDKLNGKNADVNIYIINSTDENIMNNIIKNLGYFTKNLSSFNIEHLVGLSKKNPINSIKILQNFIPMLEFTEYNLYYTDSISSLDSHMFSNYMLIDYTFVENDEEMFGYHSISFLKDGISTCYLGSKKDCIYDMFYRNYEHVKDIYTPAICNSSTGNFQTLMNDIEFIDGKNDDVEIYLFKRTPCYKRIPPIVFENIKNKLIKSGMAVEFVKKINQDDFVGEQEAEYILDTIKKEMEDRYFKAKSVYTVDILSKNGLSKFIETGRLSDHYEPMPSFSKEDIIEILLDMKKRHLDPNEQYNLYIVGDTAETNFVLTVFRNKGFLIEHANEDKSCEILNYCMIEDSDISNILYEFAKEYVPTRLAMTNKDAVEFLDYLIDQVENNI